MYLIEPCCAKAHLRELRDSIAGGGTKQFMGYGDLSIYELLPALLLRYDQTEMMILAPTLPDLAAEIIAICMNQQRSLRNGKGNVDVINHLTVIADISSDSSSDAYNRLVTTASYSDFNEESSERISDQPSAYRYAICTDYNAARRPLKGSGIFIQCMKENRYYTQGSIAVPADAMVQLVTRVRPEAVLVIDTGDNLVSQYERR